MRNQRFQLRSQALALRLGVTIPPRQLEYAPPILWVDCSRSPLCSPSPAFERHRLALELGGYAIGLALVTCLCRMCRTSEQDVLRVPGWTSQGVLRPVEECQRRWHEAGTPGEQQQGGQRLQKAGLL